VLALACFPGLAQAEESSGIQYETDVPTVPSHERSNNSSTKNPGGSKAQPESGAEASGSESPGGGAAGGNDGSNTGAGANTGQGNQASGGGAGKASNGSERAGGKLGGAKPIPSPVEAAPVSSEDGSSPLVPILIAVALLSAISIGAFLYRQRREDAGSPVSPKAS
jgi:hypothetical protein